MWPGPGKGEDHHFAKLTNEKVREIRRLCAAGVRHRQIARCYGISPSTVSDIRTGKLWKHI